MVEKKISLKAREAETLAAKAILEHFRNRPIPETIKQRLSRSFGLVDNGWVFDYAVYTDIPKGIDPNTICIDDPRLAPPLIVFRVHVKSEPREVVVEEFEGISW